MMPSDKDGQNAYIALYIADCNAPQEEVNCITRSLSLQLNPDNKLSSPDEQCVLKPGKYDIRVESAYANDKVLRKLSLSLRSAIEAKQTVDCHKTRESLGQFSARVDATSPRVDEESADDQCLASRVQTPVSEIAGDGCLQSPDERIEPKAKCSDVARVSTRKSVAFDDFVRVRIISVSSDEEQPEEVPEEHGEPMPTNQFAYDEPFADSDENSVDQTDQPLQTGRRRTRKQKIKLSDDVDNSCDDGQISDGDGRATTRRNQWEGRSVGKDSPRKRPRSLTSFDLNTSENGRNDDEGLDTECFDDDDDNDEDYRPTPYNLAQISMNARARKRVARARKEALSSMTNITDKVDDRTKLKEQFVCEICGNGYDRNKKLASHIKKRHSR